MGKVMQHRLNSCPFCGSLKVKVVTCTTMTAPDGVTTVEVLPFQQIECPECGMTATLPNHNHGEGNQVACCSTPVAWKVYAPASAISQEDECVLVQGERA